MVVFSNDSSLFVYLFERDHINQGKCWQSPLGRKRVSRSEKCNLRIWKEYEQIFFKKMKYINQGKCGQSPAGRKRVSRSEIWKKE